MCQALHHSHYVEPSVGEGVSQKRKGLYPDALKIVEEGQIILEAIWLVGDGDVETVVVGEVDGEGVYLVHLQVHLHHGLVGRHVPDGGEGVG